MIIFYQNIDWWVTEAMVAGIAMAFTLRRFLILAEIKSDFFNLSYHLPIYWHIWQQITTFVKTDKNYKIVFLYQNPAVIFFPCKVCYLVNYEHLHQPVIYHPLTGKQHRQAAQISCHRYASWVEYPWELGLAEYCTTAETELFLLAFFVDMETCTFTCLSKC